MAIVLIIKENPVLPVSFKFAGGCLLERLKAEREEYKMNRENEAGKFLSPSKKEKDVSLPSTWSKNLERSTELPAV